MKPVLLINSYAGSLNIAAHAVGAKIVGSYEDCGFGLSAQQLNYPGLDYRATTADWPRRPDLAGCVVIAHPPCAAFSVINSSYGKDIRGVKANSFQPHKVVMRYALGAGCDGLAIESVPGVLRAASVYLDYARRYRYNAFFVKLNSVTFGCPQWRPRVWILFSREPALAVDYTPNVQPLSTVMRVKGTPDFNTIFYQKTIAALAKITRVSENEAYETLYSGERIATVRKIVQDTYGEKIHERWLQACGSFFDMHYPRVVSSERWATTILHSTFFVCHGRPLFVEEYEGIMGFPRDWRWPDKLRRSYKLYLSKGVCPPVAAWVLRALGEEPAHPNLQLLPRQLCDITVTQKEAVELLTQQRRRKNAGVK